MASDTGDISMADCLNIANDIEGLSKTHISDHLVRRLVAEDWLSVSRGDENKISLGLRVDLELDDYLSENFGETQKECSICYSVFLKGLRCQTPNCQTIMHEHCARKYFVEQDESKCLTCKAEFKLPRKDAKYVEEIREARRAERKARLAGAIALE